MLLAPAGNPSSLRFGHPDVATEHTGLSPIPSPLREGGIVGAGCVGSEPRVARLGKSVRGSGEGNAGVRYRRQLAGNECWVQGIAVVPQGRQGAFPRAHRDRACCSPMRARSTAIPS